MCFSSSSIFYSFFFFFAKDTPVLHFEWILQLLMLRVVTVPQHVRFAVAAKDVSRICLPHLPFPVPISLILIIQLDDWVSCFVCKLPWLGSLWRRENEIVLRILRENYGGSWPWEEEKTRLPCSINCYLRETDIQGGRDSGFGNLTNLSKWKWQCALQFSTNLHIDWWSQVGYKLSVFHHKNWLCKLNMCIKLISYGTKRAIHECAFFSLLVSSDLIL